MNLNESIVENAALEWFAGTAGVLRCDVFGSGAVFCQSPPSSRNLPSCSRNLNPSSCNLPPNSRNTSENKSSMCRVRELGMAFPDAPNNSRQAYTTGKT